MNALQHLRSVNRRETKLDNGEGRAIMVGYHLPDASECLVRAAISAPNNRPMQVVVLRQLMVAAMLDDVDGIKVKDVDRLAIARAFSPAQREQLFDLADESPEETPETPDEQLEKYVVTPT
jgi:hypothetical protein